MSIKINIMNINNSHKHSELESDIIQLICFYIGDIEFGVNIFDIEEIIQISEITPIPRASYFIEGVISLREEIIPVVDLRKKLATTISNYNIDVVQDRLIIAMIENKKTAFIVNQVSKIIKVEKKSIFSKPPITMQGIDENSIEKVVQVEDKFIILLEISKLFTDQEKQSLNVEL